ncbi:MAG: diguanylate cyclase [Flavobacterium sp.]|nr:diguanylate cyclase [Flavobacterium sp.]
MKPVNKSNIINEPFLLKEDKLPRKLSLSNNQTVFENVKVDRKINVPIYLNSEFDFQYRDGGLVAELILANKELAFQYEEKEKRAAELVIANIELDFQNKEKEKCASELIIANNELMLQNVEKEKRVIELITANKELAFEKLEKNIRESELLIANKKLIFKTQESQIKTAELNIANRNLKIAEEKQREYIKGLEEMMFITSHKVRQPIANILGFLNMLDQTTSSPEELKQSVDCIKQSAITLDFFTRELTTFICELDQKEKKDQKVKKE